MSSKTQKTEAIRERKEAPHKENRKADKKRIRQNLEVIGKAEKKA
jgi:hypothetical protein